MIKFHEIYKSKNEKEYVMEALESGSVSGDGKYTELVTRELGDIFSNEKILMTTSCSHSIELALELVIKDGRQEVIIPSFGFPSVATAVLNAGFIPVLARVDFRDMNIDPDHVLCLINDNTRGIIGIHYGGYPFDIDRLMEMKKKHNLFLIEDCAQGFLSRHKGTLLGTIGDFGCFSFHGTKNITCGEGGCLIINSEDESIFERAHNIRQKGTNRRQFQSGQADRYYWVDRGSSYCPSDVLMAYLYGQLKGIDSIQDSRSFIFRAYYQFFKDVSSDLIISFSGEKEVDGGNGHLFYICFGDSDDASRFIDFMESRNIQTFKHFYPLIHSPMGKKFACSDDFEEEIDLFDRLVRLPIYPSLGEENLEYILKSLGDFF